LITIDAKPALLEKKPTVLGVIHYTIYSFRRVEREIRVKGKG
jgi:hypothetical protein